MAAIAHPWNVTPREAIRIQRDVIRPAIRMQPLPARVRLIAGGDCAFDKGGSRAFAAWVVWDRETGEVVERAWAASPLEFPYVPGLLTFREGPALLQAWRLLGSQPDLLMFDGNGYAHPRRCGLACHMGVVLDRPSVGVAKSRLCGQADEPGRQRGAAADLVLDGEAIGKVLRTRDGAKPVFVSIGHRATLADAVRMTLACCTRYRLPEPTRLADQLVGQVKRGEV
ncbi:MAG: Endonuclease V [Phycisphaerae bacterium]|nr:Endonuclease V [Phycisphaerae bacterium]